MKRLISKFIFLLSIILITVAFVVAQACEVDASTFISVVDETCGGIGRDEVCYGNYEVTLIPQVAAPAFSFTSPGDLTSLNSVRSLVLSSFNPDTDIWGIAQMRLLASTNAGTTQDVTLLLFGDVSIENAVEATTTIDVLVGNVPANIRSTPSSTVNNVIYSATSGTRLEALARLEDSSWVRVRVPENDSIGWVFADLISPASVDEPLTNLVVQSSNTPHYGTMQAFYYTSGTTPNCANMAADGLIIQTPNGNARVNLLINEVSIELIGGNNGATAFITANPQNGMTVNMIDGTGVVSADGTSFFVGATNATTIPMSNDMSPAGEPTIPITYDVDEVSTVALLPVVRAPDSPAIGVIPTTEASTNTTGTNSTSNTNTASGGTDTGAGNTGGGSNANSNNGNANGNANGNNGNGNANGNSGNGNANGNSGNGNANGNSGNGNGNANGNSGNGNANGNSGNGKGNG